MAAPRSCLAAYQALPPPPLTCGRPGPSVGGFGFGFGFSGTSLHTDGLLLMDLYMLRLWTLLCVVMGSVVSVVGLVLGGRRGALSLREGC